MHRLTFAGVSVAIAIAVAAAGTARAGGLFVGEAGTQANERGGAFVAKADDPSAIWINPAGVVKTGRAEIYLGSSFIDYSLSFDRDGLYRTTDGNAAWEGSEMPGVEDRAGVQPIPSLGATYRWRNLGIGLGVFGPNSNPKRDFQCDTDDCLVEGGSPLPVRYDLVSQEALFVFPSLAVAYRVHPMIDVGVRGSWGFGNINARTFTWGVRNYEEDIEKDGDFNVEASDSFVPTFGAGVLVRPVPNLEIGLAYSSQADIRATGNATADLGARLGIGDDRAAIYPVADEFAACEAGGTPSALKTCLSINLPQTFAIGARFVFRDAMGAERGDIELDGKWENWSAASDIDVTVDGRSVIIDADTGEEIGGTGDLRPQTIKHGFRDTFAVRLGGSWRFPMGANLLEARAGVAYDTAAAPTSWTRLDIDGMERITASLGAAFEISERYRIDVGFAVIIEPSRDVPTPVVDEDNPTPIDQREHPDAIQPLRAVQNQDESPFNGGHYESGYLIGSVGLTAKF
jgi:long-chain fatty acid transport protein